MLTRAVNALLTCAKANGKNRRTHCATLLIMHDFREHMMSQTHTLYVYWQEPYSNA